MWTNMKVPSRTVLLQLKVPKQAKIAFSGTLLEKCNSLTPNRDLLPGNKVQEICILRSSLGDTHQTLRSNDLEYRQKQKPVLGK